MRKLHPLQRMNGNLCESELVILFGSKKILFLDFLSVPGKAVISMAGSLLPLLLSNNGCFLYCQALEMFSLTFCRSHLLNSGMVAPVAFNLRIELWSLNYKMYSVDFSGALVGNEKKDFL